MITKNYTRSVPMSAYATQVLYETGEGVTKQQAQILKLYYNRRTGNLQSNLSSRTFNVMNTGIGARLIINYLIRIRFLDLKKSNTGRKKKVYYPIYNRPLWGYVFGYAYKKLRYGLTANIRENITGELKATFKLPITV